MGRNRLCFIHIHWQTTLLLCSRCNASSIAPHPHPPLYSSTAVPPPSMIGLTVLSIYTREAYLLSCGRRFSSRVRRKPGFVLSQLSSFLLRTLICKDITCYRGPGVLSPWGHTQWLNWWPPCFHPYGLRPLCDLWWSFSVRNETVNVSAPWALWSVAVVSQKPSADRMHVKRYLHQEQQAIWVHGPQFPNVWYKSSCIHCSHFL